EYDVWAFRLDLTPQERSAGVDAAARPSRRYGAPGRGFGHHGYPALAMTYFAAQTYCAWLSAKTGKKYRLPTDAEWTRAARLGLGGDSALTTERRDALAWHSGNARAKAHPVAGKVADALGLHDMLGNVGEWVRGARAPRRSSAGGARGHAPHRPGRLRRARHRRGQGLPHVVGARRARRHRRSVSGPRDGLPGEPGPDGERGHERRAQSKDQAGRRPRLRGLRRLSEGDREQGGRRAARDAARVPRAAPRRGDRGRQARLHGEARGRGSGGGALGDRIGRSRRSERPRDRGRNAAAPRRGLPGGDAADPRRRHRRHRRGPGLLEPGRPVDEAAAATMVRRRVADPKLALFHLAVG